MHSDDISNDIAIIGLSGRFPGAANVEEFWDNLCGGRIALRQYSRQEINDAVSRFDFLSIPHLTKQMREGTWVNAGFHLDDFDKFDCGFFGYTPAEAELLDPQQRIFLECAWAALEDAGYVPDNCPGIVGVYGGTGLSRYFINNVFANREIMYSSRDLTAGIGNEPDYLTNRVAYKLNLTGPSITVQTACSTSLVAIHLAVQSLLAGETSMCIAGGAMVQVPDSIGYLYQEGSMNSPDGNIRAFDARAQGTNFAEGGVGIVVLKRLADAVEDGDNIYAVIRGSAVNNDGNVKAGYTAPGVNGQVAVISEALSVSGLSPEDITYVEAHGTGTPLGDPVEITALTKAYRQHTDKAGWCAIGSVKPNIGHLAPAAGVAGVIKAALAVHTATIPPSLNYETPNPRIDFASSPFYVNGALSPWKTDGRQRVAAVSSFGIGGTNAHLILAEPPPQANRRTRSERHLRTFQLSGRTPASLRESAVRLAAWLDRHGDADPADIAFTLRHGRKAFEYRGAVVADTVEDLRAGLKSLTDGKAARMLLQGDAGLVLMFSGQGSQYLRMGEGLYHDLPVFRQVFDQCCDTLTPILGLDLRALLFRTPEAERAAATETLKQTRLVQPVLFAFELALARQLEALGLRPAAMIGHSLGEFVAAVLAGVFTPESALRLVALRGELMQSMPAGSMLSVARDAGELEAYLSDEVCLAADNAPGTAVLSGPAEAITAVQARLEAAGIPCRTLVTSHAFHSAMMQPIVARFCDAVREAAPRPPQIPYVSNVTGGWITPEQAVDPAYWGRHLRGAVLFRTGIETLLTAGHRCFVEAGPGNALTTFARRTAQTARQEAITLQLVRHPNEEVEDHRFFRQSLAGLWTAGLALDWSLLEPADGRRIPLPTYPFARERHWISAPKAPEGLGDGPMGKQQDLGRWSSIPSWRRLERASAAADGALEGRTILLIADEGPVADALTAALARAGGRVVLAVPAGGFAENGPDRFTLDPLAPDQWEKLMSMVAPSAILNALNVPESELRLDSCEAVLDRSFYSTLHLLQALPAIPGTDRVSLLTVTTGACDVYPGDPMNPGKAAILGLHMCAGFEYTNAATANLDVTAAELGNSRTTDAIAAELARLTTLAERPISPEDKLAALRGGFRWVAHYESVPLELPAMPARLKADGVYLITGGLGGLGLEFADFLVERGARRIALMGRSGLPDRAAWDEMIAKDDPAAARIAKIRAIEAKGAEIMVLKADIVDLDQTRLAVANLERHWGKVTGVIHSAGIAGGGLIQLKTRETADKVLSPKVRGLLVLREALSGTELDFMALFSSLFAVIGGMGQADYSAANNVLDAFARDRSLRHGERVVSINWGGWSEVGMAVDQGFVGRKAPPLPAGRTLDHPYLFSRETSADGGASYRSLLRRQDHWALEEHRIMGDSVMPGTGLLETVRAAFQDLTAADRIRLEGVYFYQPLIVPADQIATVHVNFTPRGGGRFSFECVREQDGARQMFVSGDIAALDGAAAPGRADLDALARTCAEERRVFTPDSAQVVQGDQEFLQLGARWQVIRQVDFGPDALLGRLELPPTLADDLDRFGLHPSLLDMATGPITGHLLIRMALPLEGEFLPFCYGTLEQFGTLPRELVSHVRFRGLGERKDTIHFDIALYDLDGVERVRIGDFTLKQVPARRPAPPREGVDHLDDSISPREGREVFGRLLSHLDQPQWVISTQNLPALLRALRTQAQGGAEGEGRARATVERDAADVVAPRTPLEETLLGIFEKVLGISPLSIRDNFFDLGLDSVVGIQIVSNAKGHGIALKMDQLFNHQTVEELAAAVAPAVTPAGSSAGAPSLDAFWRDQLAGGHPFGTEGSGEAVQELRLAGTVPTGLDRLERAFNVTLEDILLTALAAAVPATMADMAVRIDRATGGFPVKAPLRPADIEALKDVKARLRRAASHDPAFAGPGPDTPAPQIGLAVTEGPGGHGQGGVLEVGAWRDGGGLALRLEARAGAAAGLTELANAVETALAALAEAAKDASGPGFTAADFQEADLSEDDLQSLMDVLKD